MSLSSFSNMVASAGIILWLVITGAYVAVLDPLAAQLARKLFVFCFKN